MTSVQVERALYAIGDEPYCLWELDVRAKALEFISSIDAGYFEFLAALGAQFSAQNEVKKRASAAMRIGLFQGAETLFLLLGAWLQAPNAPHAFVTQCTTVQLRDLIRRIGSGAPLELVAPRLPQFSWEAISLAVHAQCGMKNGVETAKAYGAFWARLSQEVLDSRHVAEYNSLKHGFRVGHGGFRIDFAPASETGDPPAESDMTSLGGSDSGSSYYTFEKTGGIGKANRSVTSSRTHVNWDRDSMICGLQLISWSIANVLSALKIANGAAASTVMFREGLQNRPVPCMI